MGKGKLMKIFKKGGFSLVEIMVVTLVLAVLAMGGAAIMYETGGGIMVQGNKRIAIELANNRLEEARVQQYYGLGGIIVPAEYNVTNRYYLTDSNNDHVLELQVNDKKVVQETVNLGDIAYTMSTMIIRCNSDSSPEFNTEYLDIAVSVNYPGAGSDEVELGSIIIPPYVTEN